MPENVDLRAERARVSFSTKALTDIVWEGSERARRRREIAAYVDSHAELHPPKPVALMSREERIEHASKMAVLSEEHMQHVVDPARPEERYYFSLLVEGIDGAPFSLHHGMGIPTIMNSADDEQTEYWLPRMLAHECNVVYAQTEIGHGTSLKHLETTARYDASRDEFLLNTPTVTATKFWPGNMAKSATHAVVVAQLQVPDHYGQIIGYGPHLFIVPLRDLDTHLPQPGITVGDIGTKFGINTNDNGFLRLHDVRIPRRNMLMRHAKMSNSGEYSHPIHNKANYTGMMYVRSMMISAMAINLASAATIAIRYSCVRRQGEILPGQGEVQVLDYQTQQHRLFPQLARSFAFLFAGSHIRHLYYTVMSDLKSGGVNVMADLHGLGSGLKAQVTYQVALGIEQCRMACGGHGYSHASGIPIIYTTAVGGCTYEGENMVMLLQLGRYLLKRAKEICVQSPQLHEAAERFAGPFTKYLFAMAQTKPPSTSWRDPKTFLHAFEYLSLRLLLSAYKRLEITEALGIAHEVAWNETAVDWCKAARAHTRTFLARIFVDRVESVTDAKLRAVLSDLLHVYLAYELIDCSGALFEHGCLSSKDMAKIRANYYEALKRVRTQAIPLVDSFEFSDRELDSVLGRWDGDVYNYLLKWTRHSSLNESHVLEFHKTHLLPAMKEARKRRANAKI